MHIHRGGWGDRMSRETPRRRFVRALTVLVVGAATVGGAGSTAAHARLVPSSSSEAPSLTFAVPQDPGFLAFETSGITTYTFTRLIYDGLFRIRPTTNSLATVEPGAAESWEISDDGTVWTFHLRSGLSFTNGEALTSSDVKFSIEKLLDPQFTASGFLSSIDHVDAPDDATVVITLKEADPSFWVLV